MIQAVEFTAEAKEDVQAGARYYEDKLTGLGLQFATAVETESKLMLNVPNRYPAVSGDVRQCTVKRFPYTIYFRILENRLFVIFVYAVRRDPVELYKLLAQRK